MGRLRYFRLRLNQADVSAGASAESRTPEAGHREDYRRPIYRQRGGASISRDVIGVEQNASVDCVRNWYL